MRTGTQPAAAEHGPALAELTTGELQRNYLAQLAAVGELLAILDANPDLELTADHTRSVQRARELTQR